MIITNKRTNKQRRRGFTLIETMVAGVILVISVAGLVSFGYVNFQMTTTCENNTGASAAARSEIEQVRLEGFANALSSSTDYYDANGDYPSSATQISSSIYSAQTTVTTGALRTVCVTVSLISSGQVVYQTYTALTSGGV